MFTWKEEQMNKPVRIWLENIEEVEEGCLEQARHLAQLPFIHKWACLMPDTHQGKGMPIGGVIATDGVIIPNAVGVDIGCGMNFVSTNIKAEDLKPVMTGNGTMFQAITGEIMRNIPVGYNSYKKRQESEVLDRCLAHAADYEKNETLFPLIEDDRAAD